MRDWKWKAKESRGTFAVQKRRGNMAMEDMGLFNLSGAVNQLAWEKDMDFRGPQNPDAPSSSSQGQGQSAAAPGPVPGPGGDSGPSLPDGPGGDSGPSLPNGLVGQRAQHHQLVSTPNRRARNLTYNRVAPLLPPLPPQDNDNAASAPAPDPGDGTRKQEKKTSGGGAGVTALDLKSISSWGGDTPEHSLSEDLSLPLPSPTEEPGVGGFKDVEAGRQSPRKDLSASSSSSAFRDVELGKLSPRQEVYAAPAFPDVEAGVGVKVARARSQSEIPPASASPQRARRRKKKKSKGGKRSRESSPQKSADGESGSPRPPTDDFDSLGLGSHGRDSGGRGEKDGGEA